MPKFQEVKQAHGYTDADFGPQRIYLTPRAAETALSAGITQIRAVRPELEIIRDYINGIGNPRHHFPENIDETNFVFRWSGAGNKWRWQWDTKLYTAKHDTWYINGWNITQEALDTARRGDMPPLGIAKSQLDPHHTIEVDVNNWEDLDVAKQVAIGALYNFFASHTPGVTIRNLKDDVEQARLDLLSVSRKEIVNTAAAVAAQAGRGFDQIMPIAPLYELPSA